MSFCDVTFVEPNQNTEADILSVEPKQTTETDILSDKD